MAYIDTIGYFAEGDIDESQLLELCIAVDSVTLVIVFAGAEFEWLEANPPPPQGCYPNKEFRIIKFAPHRGLELLDCNGKSIKHAGRLSTRWAPGPAVIYGTSVVPSGDGFRFICNSNKFLSIAFGFDHAQAQSLIGRPVPRDGGFVYESLADGKPIDFKDPFGLCKD
jgi:hypothetical protein